RRVELGEARVVAADVVVVGVELEGLFVLRQRPSKIAVCLGSDWQIVLWVRAVGRLGHRLLLTGRPLAPEARLPDVGSELHLGLCALGVLVRGAGPCDKKKSENQREAAIQSRLSASQGRVAIIGFLSIRNRRFVAAAGMRGTLRP